MDIYIYQKYSQSIKKHQQLHFSLCVTFHLQIVLGLCTKSDVHENVHKQEQNITLFFKVNRCFITLNLYYTHAYYPYACKFATKNGTINFVPFFTANWHA